MSNVTEDMVISTVDQQDTPIGTIIRRNVFNEHDNFRVAHTLVFNETGALLIQRLAFTRSRHPGYWGSSVAGYLFAGETYERAAQRRLAEELGIQDAKLEFVGKTSMNDQGCKKFIGVFKTVVNGPFQYDQAHIAQLEFVTVQSIRQLQLNGQHLFTPTFLSVLDFYQNRYPAS